MPPALRRFPPAGNPFQRTDGAPLEAFYFSGDMADIGANVERLPTFGPATLQPRAGAPASLAWVIFQGWSTAKLTGVRAMSLNASVGFFDQYLLYAALAAPVAVFGLLWKIWKKVRSIERQMNRLRTDVVRLQNIESRRLLDAVKSDPVAAVKSNESDSLSIVPEATSSGLRPEAPSSPAPRSRAAPPLEEM
jgi:hypothetical protein